MMKSYLNNRSKAVSLGGKMSEKILSHVENNMKKSSDYNVSIIIITLQIVNVHVKLFKGMSIRISKVPISFECPIIF